MGRHRQGGPVPDAGPCGAAGGALAGRRLVPSGGSAAAFGM